MTRTREINPTIAEFEKDELCMKWMDSFDRINTKLSYRNGLRAFYDFTKTMPCDLIKEAREDYINRVPPWELRHIKRIEDFLTHLKKDKKDLANYTLANYFKAVKHFYTFHKIPVMLKSNITQKAKDEYLDLPILKIEDIRKAVLSTGRDKFLKAFILTTLSSGQAQAELRALKGKHLKNVVNGVVVVNMTRGKTQRRYFFFIGQEALEAIREYKSNLRDDEFVFTQARCDKPQTVQAITTMFERFSEHMGFEAGYFAAHRFRHYFKSALQGNMDNGYIEYLMGHKLPGVESSYFLGNQDKMLEQYVKNQHLLTIFTDQEVLQKQYDELKAKHDSLTSMFTPDMIQKMIDERFSQLTKKVNLI